MPALTDRFKSLFPKKQKEEDHQLREYSRQDSIRDKARPYMYILPAAIVMAAITLYPLIFQFFMAFTNYAPHHLRLEQGQAVTMVMWDFTKPIPKEFKEDYKEEFEARYNRKPKLYEIKDAYRNTEEYQEAYFDKLIKIGIPPKIAPIIAKNPLGSVYTSNFNDIVISNKAVKEFADPTEELIPESSSRLGYRMANLMNLFKGGLKIPNYNFGRLFIFNFVWTIVNVILHVIIGVMVAVALNAHGVRLKGLYRGLFILPYAIPNFVTATAWRNMFDTEYGAVNQTIRGVNDFFATILGQNPETFSIISENIDWLRALEAPFGIDIFPLPFYAALITNVWLGWPFMMVIATGALQSIPRELYQAAHVDGASAWKQFWSITVPMFRPAMAPAIMLGFIWTFNQFNVIYLVSAGAPLGKTEIMVTQAYRLIHEHRKFGAASAFSIVVFIILFAVNWYLKKITRATEAANE